MFISRLEIPWQSARNPYDLHRHIWHLFPGVEKEIRRTEGQDRSGFLFRIEDYRAGRPVRLLVQSRLQPQPAPGLALLGVREFDPQPQAGQHLAFILTANPIKTITDQQADEKPGKRADKLGKFKCRVPLIDEEEQRSWLAAKLAGGADLGATTVLPHSPVYFRKGGLGGKLVTVTFEGDLRVKDPARLAGFLRNGIGPAKSFGCGLLLVRRLS
jgi:CRISPR system Cascade subunit CasE